MAKLITAKNKEFDVSWLGVSTVDGALRFEVTGSDVDTIHSTFRDPEQTAILTEVKGTTEKEYAGYTDYRGFDKKYDGSIVVALNRVIARASSGFRHSGWFQMSFGICSPIQALNENSRRSACDGQIDIATGLSIPPGLPSLPPQTL